ncbi:hypothetical protein E2C06_32485 [Dankookia rubra]|uniref:non-specific protein-tyrosine kinase n=1 Tax=Dankookia rubra TaxID=1442381 RepID=A0A4V3A9A0_9PROT|nr:polysaccharide biosynthesis tyrosine autokinase [Dankookia rubra]TDH58465.1 hypothetical protein E2C06_32485 [Dankookia rubra]
MTKPDYIEDGAEVGQVVYEPKATSPALHAPAGLWDAIRRQKWLILAVSAISFSAALTAIFQMPQTFRASSTILLEARRVLPVKHDDASSDPAPNAETIVQNELQVLQARNLLEQIVWKLSLEQDPNFNSTLNPSITKKIFDQTAKFLATWAPHDGRQSPQPNSNRVLHEIAADPVISLDATVEGLRKAVQIRPVPRSHVIQIHATAAEPETAAAIANTLADLYIEAKTAQREAELRDVSNWVNSQLGQLRAQADASARAVAEFHISNGIVRGVARGDRSAELIQQEISEVSSHLVAVQARRIEFASKLRNAEAILSSGDIATLTDVLNSRTTQALRAQEAQIAGRNSELSSRLGPGHPSVISGTAELADIRRKLAQEAARVLQAYRNDLRAAEENEAALTQRVGQLRAEIGRKSITEVRLQELQREADADRMLMESYLARARQISAEVSFRDAKARLVSPASLPRRPESPRLLLLLPLSFIASLGMGAIAAVVREHDSKGLWSFDELERQLGLSPLGVLPRRRRKTGNVSDPLYEEAMAGFCAHLVRRPRITRLRSVLITSALPGEGKSTTARFLAAEASARGMRVMLVEADLRRPSINCDGAVPPGLSDVLRRKVGLEEVIQTVQDGGYFVLPSGTRPINPTQLITSEEMDRLLHRLEQTYDLVVIDSAPILVGSDVAQLSRCVSETILLVRWGHTGWRAIAAALRRVAIAGGSISGVVMTMVDTRKHTQYLRADSIPHFSSSFDQYWRSASGATKAIKRATTED